MRYSIGLNDFCDVNSSRIPIHILLSNTYSYHFRLSTKISRQTITMDHSSLVTPAPTTPNEVVEDQHAYENEHYPAPQSLPLEPVFHVPNHPGYVLELSTPSFPLVGYLTREQLVQSYGTPPVGLPQIGSFIHLRYPNERVVYFGVRVVGYEAQSKLFDVPYDLGDGPNIERVNLQDGKRQYHYALYSQGFDRVNSPKSASAYLGRVIQFPISRKTAVIVYYMEPRGPICIDRPHP